MITATMLRGRHNRRGRRLTKGDVVELHQWCNDWFMLKDGTILSPRTLQIDGESRRTILESAKQGKTGLMFELYDPIIFADTGRFVRRK